MIDKKLDWKFKDIRVAVEAVEAVVVVVVFLDSPMNNVVPFVVAAVLVA